MTLSEIEALAAKATPGPWEWTKHGELNAASAPLPDRWSDIVLWENGEPVSGARIIETDGGVYPPRGLDREFIAAAREAVPALAAALRIAVAALRVRGITQHDADEALRRINELVEATDDPR